MASAARSAINLTFYYVVRPLARVLPLRVLDVLGAVGLAPMALGAALWKSERTRVYFDLVGLSPGFASRLRFSYRELRERWRSTFFFLDPKREARKPAGSDDAIVGIQLTTLHAGMRYLGVWVKQRDGRIVYIADPLELARGAGGVAAAEKWPYYTHDLHHQVLRHHHVAPGGAFRKLVPALTAGRPVFLCQEAVWLPDAREHGAGDAANATFFGVPVYWPVGARALAEQTIAPLAFTEVRFEHGRWRMHQDGPLSFESDEALRRYMEARLRAHPWAWMHWRVFVDELLERRAAEAQRIVVDPGDYSVADPVAEAA